MSSDTYKLRVVIDDSKIKEIERRLSGLGGGQSTGSSSSVANAFGGKGGMMKNLGKLAAIAIGVTAIVGLVKKITSLVVESSPMLQAMFKLFNTAILFIFRPIGDFIGFFLRPIMIFLLRNIAIPFYRVAAPLMRTWGAQLGTAVANFLKDPFKSLTDWFGGIKWIDILGIGGVVGILTNIAIAVGLFNIDLGAIGAGVSEQLTNLFNKTSTILGAVFGGFISNIRGPIAGVVQFFTGVFTSITNALQPAWDALMGFIQGIIDFFKGIFEFLGGGFLGGDSGGGGRTPGSSRRGGGDIVVNIDSINTTDLSGSSSGVQIGEDISKTIHKRVRGFI